MIPEISARISDVHDELRRMLDHLDQFPDPEAVKRVEGSRDSVAGPFAAELSSLAAVASAATTHMMQSLAEMDGAVRTTLDDLVEQDETLAISAERFESFLDDATAPQSQPQPNASPAAGRGDDAASASGFGPAGDGEQRA